MHQSIVHQQRWYLSKSTFAWVSFFSFFREHVPRVVCALAPSYFENDWLSIDNHVHAFMGKTHFFFQTANRGIFQSACMSSNGCRSVKLRGAQSPEWVVGGVFPTLGHNSNDGKRCCSFKNRSWSTHCGPFIYHGRVENAWPRRLPSYVFCSPSIIVAWIAGDNEGTHWYSR
jgi:hypothetical protein